MPMLQNYLSSFISFILVSIHLVTIGWLFRTKHIRYNRIVPQNLLIIPVSAVPDKRHTDRGQRSTTKRSS